jgi:hypothetical protein
MYQFTLLIEFFAARFMHKFGIIAEFSRPFLGLGGTKGFNASIELILVKFSIAIQSRIAG